MSAPVILRLDAQDARLRQLLPAAADRIEAFARMHQPEVDPREFATAALARVWAGDARVLLLGIVDFTTARLVGHVLAEHQTLVSEHWVIVAQAEVDGKAQDQKFAAVDIAKGWARERKVHKLLVSANGDGKQWEKRLGAKFYRHVLMLPLTEPHDDGPTPEPGG